ncbi:hypothetical protein LB941_04470 [Ligilactobacillus sp. WILCCON 0076]|uniref:Uncharacterized protein n=1 Tax=Ligilactobacillus ubinensis TaxID=2876789 RepID=A0A9X2JLZ3_9LACO|nr:hypothetical protein [Ligilactobacillus ubinensis]MCP0886591.1 hypothetical protein [Ligilactobacillus ubinensis]
MKKNNLPIIPLAFIAGAAVGNSIGSMLKHQKHGCNKNHCCHHHEPACCDKSSTITDEDPVYIRETQTSGHGL